MKGSSRNVHRRDESNASEAKGSHRDVKTNPERSRTGKNRKERNARKVRAYAYARTCTRIERQTPDRQTDRHGLSNRPSNTSKVDLAWVSRFVCFTWTCRLLCEIIPPPCPFSNEKKKKTPWRGATRHPRPSPKYTALYIFHIESLCFFFLFQMISTAWVHWWKSSHVWKDSSPSNSHYFERTSFKAIIQMFKKVFWFRLNKCHICLLKKTCSFSTIQGLARWPSILSLKLACLRELRGSVLIRRGSLKANNKPLPLFSSHILYNVVSHCTLDRFHV